MPSRFSRAGSGDEDDDDDNNDDDNNDDDEDVGLTVSEGDDGESDRDGDNDDKDEEARIKTLADESPGILAFLGNHSDSDIAAQNTTAIATTSEDDDNDDNDEDNALDDSSIEEEEEAAIRAELGRKSQNRRRSIPGPVSLRRLSQSQSQQTRGHSQDDNSDESDGDSDDSSSSSSSSSSWGNEYLEDYFDQPVSHAQRMAQNGASRGNGGDDDSDHESHLWQYFFSSEDGDDGFDGRADSAEPEAGPADASTSINPRPLTAPKSGGAGAEGDGSTDDDLPLKGRGPIPLPEAAPSGYVPSGDSTDEDDGVPPERKRRRARGTKAIEVLGSNSFSTRPPVLGSWRIKGDKNVGIIDGLTTRTLSPPPVPQDRAHFDGSPRSHCTPTRSGEPVDPFENLGDTPQDSVTGLFAELDSSFDLGATPAQGEHGGDVLFDDVEVSDLDLLEMGDYINTTGLSSDENDGGAHDNFEIELDFENADQALRHQLQTAPQRQFRSPAVSPYIYRSRFPSRSVPISAFRNRGSPYVHNPAYPSDNQSPAPRRARGSSVTGRRPSLSRDAFMSPARQARKRMKKVRTGPGPRSALAGHHAPPGAGGQPYEDDTHDLLGELIEIGAISPLFDINQ